MKFIFQFVDYLTNTFLDEKYKRQHLIAGKISTLGKIAEGKGAHLGEFMFDKEL